MSLEEKLTVDEAFEVMVDDWQYDDCLGIMDKTLLRCFILDMATIQELRGWLCDNVIENEKLALLEDVYDKM